MTKKDAYRVRKNKKLGVDHTGLPKSDDKNVWHPDFGWILKDGKPTIHAKPYWAMMRRKTK